MLTANPPGCLVADGALRAVPCRRAITQSNFGSNPAALQRGSGHLRPCLGRVLAVVAALPLLFARSTRGSRATSQAAFRRMYAHAGRSMSRVDPRCAHSLLVLVIAAMQRSPSSWCRICRCEDAMPWLRRLSQLSTILRIETRIAPRPPSRRFSGTSRSDGNHFLEDYAFGRWRLHHAVATHADQGWLARRIEADRPADRTALTAFRRHTGTPPHCRQATQPRCSRHSGVAIVSSSTTTPGPDWRSSRPTVLSGDSADTGASQTTL